MQKSLLLLVLLFLNFSVQATQPPTEKQIEKYKKDGTLRQKAERAKAYGNLKIAPNLLNNLKYRAELKTSSSTTSFNKKADLVLGNFASLGTPKMLVLLVEFPEYLHKATNSREQIANKIFGQGDAELFPYDSLTEFYKRSSYNKVDIQGNVLDWYQAPHPRPVDTGDNAWQVKQQIVKDAINHHEALGHDFTQYDNDGDGAIDYIAVIWTGPPGEWASLWWGTYSTYGDDSFVVDGKTLRGISWQQVSYDVDEGPFTAQTLIHETGHAMGLADYYDYAPDIGPKGGVGGLDQMGGNYDHNAFSKYLLGWLTPQFVGSGSEAINLLSSTSTADALLIMPSADESTIYDEFFIVESRKQEANDTYLPNTGILIWHVDATLNEWSWFKNDNSYSDDKFLRLVQADGLNEIENLGSVANAEDFYTTGGEFSPDTMPQSRNNAQLQTGVKIADMTVDENVAFIGEILPNVPDFSLINLDEYQALRNGETSSVAALADTDIANVEIYVDNTLITTLHDAPFNIVWTDDNMTLGSHKVAIKVSNSDGNSSTAHRDVMYLNNEKSALIVSLGKRDIDNDTQLESMLSEAGINIVTSTFVFPLDNTDFSFVFVNYGSANGPWVSIEEGSDSKTAYGIARAASSNEVAAFSHYINQGGSIIIQGEGVFSYSAQEFSDLFGVDVEKEGLNVTNVFADNVYQQRAIDVSLSESEDIVQVDLFKAQDSIENSHTILTASGDYYDWDAGQWLQTQGTCSLNQQVSGAKVIISSCLTRRLDKYSKGVLFNNYLAFLGVNERIAINRKPVISAGSDQTIAEGSSVTLAGSAKDDDDDNLTITWSQSSGPAVTLSNINSLTPTFTAPEVSSNQNVVFELSVSDGIDTVINQIVITIKNVNRKPIISAGSNQTITEGSSVTLAGSAKDDDNDNLTITWSQSSGPAVTLSSINSLTPTFPAPEVSTSQTVVFELSVSDGTEMVTDTVSITIRDSAVTPPSSGNPSSSSGGGSTTFYNILMLLLLFFVRQNQACKVPLCKCTDVKKLGEKFLLNPHKK
ncbi:M6 family metalloprotease domain-containing protein [Paraglaciecola hydrolytica]|uniref:Peptidase M6-like domain-containing protein n=1 Tax=Paraglaciecola hydrolytica TaxID=1799789 RepID=A0A148KKR8_9ALTE|nr:M6 family metalloprotease domain-containing protein [Paraglaciecola hydrolytica]KXI26869.1 hypothetical protein AX660_03645 [Paraglaciecola hydrolytica]